MSGHQTTAPRSAEWCTPPSVFEALDLEFDLDPCAPPGGLPWIPAARFLSLKENGLAVPWEGRVWLNPPYGNQTGLWLGKLAAHGDGVALTFARTDTEWFQAVAPRCETLCFIARRLRFIDAKGKPGRYTGGAPSVLLAFGPRAGAAVERCGLGVVAYP